MELYSDEIMADLPDDDLATASLDGEKWSNRQHKGGQAAGHFIKWHTIKNQEASVAQDVRRTRKPARASQSAHLRLCL
jgi:carbonic anhydrase